MRLGQFDLNLMLALDALLTEANVSRAGARVGLAQSAMSNLLTRLRRHYEDDLLTPVGRRMVLTPFAEQLRAPIRELIEGVQSLTAVRTGFDPASASQNVIILASDFVTAQILPIVSRRMAAEAPAMQLTVKRGDLDQQVLEEFDQGRLGLLIVPQFRALPGHPIETLSRDRFVCMVWEGNTAVGETVTVEAFVQMPQAVTEVHTAYANPHRKAVQSLNFAGPPSVRVPSSEVLADYIVKTDRIGILPERAARRAAMTHAVRIIEPPVDFGELVEVVQWHRSFEHDPAIAWMRGLLRQATQDQNEETADGQ